MENFPILDVHRIHEREAQTLAPYAMKSGDSLGRLVSEQPSRFRTCYQRDRDRIVHSAGFRRLEYKTQVFVNHEGDHYRTRLTHTLEVAQISRSIARALGLNEDLVEAVSLAHDLGHPPFGHAGEDALDACMEGYGGFNHNAHSLRVIDVLEAKYAQFEGLNLSFEIRESTIKHGGHFAGENLAPEFHPEWSPLLEAQLSDVADSLAYTNHDIDDGLRSNFITLDGLRSVAIWREAEEEVGKQFGALDDRTLVTQVVSYLIDLQVLDLIEATRSRLIDNSIQSVNDVRAYDGELVDFSEDMVAAKGEMQVFLRDNLYGHYRTLKMAEKAKRFLHEMFVEYQRNPKQLPPVFVARVDEVGVERTICDYLAGMTDRFAQEEYQRLFHPFERL